MRPSVHDVTRLHTNYVDSRYHQALLASRERGWLRVMPHETFGMLGVSGREDPGAGVLNGRCAAVVNVEGGVHSDT